MSQTFDYLADLNARKLQWNFKVYVIRVWQLPNRYNEGEVGTIEVIIEDSQGTRLQVSIPKSLVSKWRGVLVQFQMYIMTNFIVVDNQKGNISRGKYLLFFSHRTIVSHVENPSFSLNAFRFRTIRELLNAEKIDDSALFDMIGEVVGKEDPKELITSKGKETKRLAVILEDLENNRIGCTIFGEMVDQLLRHMQDGRVEPLIVVVQYFKATRWNGKTSVQSHFDISQLHIDSNLKDVAEFRSRLLGGEPSSSVRISQVPSKTAWSGVEELKQGAVSVKTIEEVLIQHEEGPAWIAASIVAINVTKDDWFYKSCRKCPKKVETPIGNRYECGKFKVEVMVFDGTGSIRLLLWDKETSMLCGKRAEQIMEDDVIVGDEYPKTLDNMMEKRVLFKINIKEANINQFDHVYTVMKICDDEDIIDKNLSKELSTNLPSNVSVSSLGQVQIPHLQDAPKELYNLLYEDSPKSKHFRDNIRAYNNMFQFTSMGAKIDRSINRSKGPATFILCGENYHLMGSLIPPEGNVAKFAQLYVYDTQNEIQNRMNIFSRAENQLIHEDIVKDLKKMLDEHNVLVKAFRMVRESMRVDSRNSVKLRLLGKRGKDGRRYNLPSTNEIAALIVGDFDIDNNDRDIVVETQTGKLQRINQLNPAYLGLQYPLLFPYGEDGFKEDISLSKPTSNDGKGRQHMSMREFFAFRIQERLADGSPLLYSRRLFQQFLVDAYSMIESSRLNYIRHNQDKFRCEMYKQIKDAVLNGETTPSCKGKRIILPSSFTGGPRYMIQNYQDAMAICKVVGYPDLFITFTCNPKWPELEDFFDNRELRAEDRPDMVCRAFKVKLDCLIKDIKANRIFGRVSAVVYTIEFQKRGLPHAHILIFLHPDDKYPTGEEIDQIISAEIPDREKDPVYFDAVEKHMMHGPCGNFRKQSPCMENGKCIRHFPKRFVDETTVDEDGYPLYRRRDDGRIINKSGVDLDNRYVVPHNRFLLLRYGAHINVEWCNQSRSIKYLFKYVNKGNDRVTTAFYKSVGEDVESDEIDEISMYYDCRYISPCEAVWRIFGYSIHYRDPSVVRLGFHLPDEQNVIFKDHDNLDEVAREASVKESMFLGWFEANKEYREARSLTFAELPTKFVWKAQQRIWVPRKSHAVIGRIFFVPPGSGEIYYLRLLLNLVKGPTCYEDIRTVDGTVYSTFRDACYARGLLDDDREYIDAIQEANNWGSGEYLRKLFATLLFSNSMTRPEYVWDNTWHILSDDILHRQKRILDNPDLSLTEQELKDLTLIDIENKLKTYNKSLKEFSSMPFPDMEMCSSHLVSSGINRLISDEQQYDRHRLADEHSLYLQQLTDEQHHVYDRIIQSVNDGVGGVYFLYGYGGTGKTFVWKTLASGLRSRGQIVLTVASSGIAALLLPGGRTAHSRFAIPLNVDEFSTCNIKQGSALAELIIKTKLIIWDEAPMVNKHCIEALDRTMRDLLRFKNVHSEEQPFGGKTIVFGGDFRQILPVIPKGSRQDIMNATINSSYIWNSCNMLKLTRNMRLQADDANVHSSELKDFAEWILSIGDGKCGESKDGIDTIQIPNDILIKEWEDPIAAICRAIYPEMFWPSNSVYEVEDRAILAPTLQIVDEINRYMMSLNPCESQTYYSSDKACPTEPSNELIASIHTPEFLNTIRCSGIPNHELTVKVGTPIMLLWNIDHSAGLCNGTRLVITKLGKHIIEAKSMTGKNAGQKVFIPRMTLSPSDHRIPFKFQRRQFPIMVSYAMTINKSQGQSLSKVGLILKKPVFTHGQLYVAISRVTNKKGLKILLCHEEERSNETDNVVFKEVFRNV